MISPASRYGTPVADAATGLPQPVSRIPPAPCSLGDNGGTSQATAVSFCVRRAPTSAPAGLLYAHLDVGGADIIDIKEPSRGALGAADADVIRAVAAEVPPFIPVSVALGDPDTAEVPVSISRRVPYRDAGEIILKLGFAGSTGEIEAEQRLIAAIRSASADPRPAVVAVAYADYERARAPSPSAVVRAAARAGADGVLLDTFTKDGRDLFAFFPPEALQRWVEDARALRLMVALAGSLDSNGIRRARSTRPDVVGVRGAACNGGRLGQVSADRVRALRLALAAPDGLNGPTANRHSAVPRLA